MSNYFRLHPLQFLKDIISKSLNSLFLTSFGLLIVFKVESQVCVRLVTMFSMLLFIMGGDKVRSEPSVHAEFKNDPTVWHVCNEGGVFEFIKGLMGIMKTFQFNLLNLGMRGGSR